MVGSHRDRSHWRHVHVVVSGTTVAAQVCSPSDCNRVDEPRRLNNEVAAPAAIAPSGPLSSSPRSRSTPSPGPSTSAAAAGCPSARRAGFHTNFTTGSTVARAAASRMRGSGTINNNSADDGVRGSETSDENNVGSFSKDPDDEKARWVIAEAQRLARPPRDDRQAQLSDARNRSTSSKANSRSTSSRTENAR